ncbi:hypothetical protein [Serratia marcescens]|uniref:hypothetical protein n=1 Tax=Serratia marcescens TaxID=615 RepID=UPI0011517536|nr:hypothetical protein [Serratia marcescens]HEJ7121076.1 hypothetical protein [Serratia marcescens]
MSTEKLSELSKPVAWRYRYTKPGITDSHGEAWVGDWKFVTDEVNCNPAPNYQKCALYSQEYVSALLADNEALKIRAGEKERLLISNAVDYEYDLIEMKRRAEAAEQRASELEAKLATPVRSPDDGLDDCRDMWPSDCSDDFDTGYKFGLWRYEQNIRAAGFTVEGDE